MLEAFESVGATSFDITTIDIDGQKKLPLATNLAAD
jgi:hypothetical protein